MGRKGGDSSRFLIRQGRFDIRCFDSHEKFELTSESDKFRDLGLDSNFDIKNSGNSS
jgi:hypothetical protein